MDFEEHITIDDMPNDDCREIYKAFGKAVAIGLLNLFAGNAAVYFPKNWQSKVKMRLVLDNPDNLDAGQMARAYDMSIAQIYKILNQRHKREKQMDLLEEEK